MRWAPCLLLVLLGCGNRKPPSTENLYQEARDLLRSERNQVALKTADSALQHAARNSVWYWRLQLLRAEILQEQRERKLAAAALNFQLPAGPQWTAEWSRFRLCQANLAYRQQRFEEARARLDEAKRLAASAGESGTLAEIELRQASVDTREGRFPEATAHLSNVLDYAAQQSDSYLEMKATGNMGFMLLNSARYEEAIPWFEKALAKARALKAQESEPRALLNLGWCYYRLGDLDKAQNFFQDAEAGFEKTANRFESQNCLGNIGNALDSRHEYGAAASYYKQALEKATDLGDRYYRALWMNNLARVEIKTGDLNSAERYNNEAWPIWKELKNSQAEAYSIVNAALIAAGRKDFARAEDLFHSVILQTSTDPVPLLEARAGLARALAGQGNTAAAEAEYRATDSLMEHQRSTLLDDQLKVSYFSSLIEFYQDYVDYLMAHGRSEQALEVVESSRARDLADRLSLARIRRGPGTAAGFRKLAAESGSVLMSYWIAPRGSWLWVITGSAVHVFAVPPEDQVRAMVEAYDAFLQNARDPMAAENPAGRQLYENLVAPAQSVLPKNARIVVAPDGPLYALNFETLPVAQGSPHYWIEDVTLSITPSLGLLETERVRSGTGRRSLLLVGNPVSPVAQYPPLQFAAQEMSGIEKNLSTFHQTVLEGPRAGPDAYSSARPGDFEIIHFVAHAVANAKEPLDSAVILSRQGAEYKLRAKDVLGTRLSASLVTLSACRSAGARTYAGEGLMGLAWAFLQAGAKNVIAGLWDVNDRSTAELAAHLYGGLAQGADPATALRAAKRQLIRAGGVYGRPYYWGPFELFTRQPQQATARVARP